MKLLKREFPDFKFLVIIEKWVVNDSPAVLEGIPEDELIFLIKERIFISDLPAKFDMVFLSMAYPNLFRLDLVHISSQRFIPVISIEEVNQLALNDSRINHYFLPLDRFGVASYIEKEKFSEIGCNSAALEVTGWPFYSMNTIENSVDLAEQNTIPPGKKIATLILSSLKSNDPVSLETEDVRRSLISIVSRGIPRDYQLVIKPHPLEKKSEIKKIERLLPDSIVVDPKLNVEYLLDRSDVVLSRGNSQVIFIAMLKKIPVIVIPAGLNTIFNGGLEKLTVNNSKELRKIIENINKYNTSNFSGILKSHFPFSKDESLERIRQLFNFSTEKVGNEGEENRSVYISILYAYLKDVKMALQILSKLENTKKKKFTLLKKLFKMDISSSEFRNLIDGFPEEMKKWHLRSLFIRSLLKNRLLPEIREGLSVIKVFPGQVNIHYFINDIIKKTELECMVSDKQNIEFLSKEYSEYVNLSFYKTGFKRIKYVYGGNRRARFFREVFWPVKDKIRKNRDKIKLKFFNGAK